MSRPRGGYIGVNPAPAASGLNSAASGIWTLREAEALKRAGTWPTTFASPTQISGLQLWLDASDSSTLYDATSGGSLVAADGTVKRWQDKSGNNRHATEATNGPQRKTAIQGGKDVLRFDGSNDTLQVTYNLNGVSGVTIFAVFSRLANATAYAFSNYIYEPSPGAGILFGGSTSKAVTASGRPDNNASFRSADAGATTQSFLAGTAKWDGTTLTAYFNSTTSQSTAASAATLSCATGLVLGKTYATDPQNIQAFSNVDIGEMIVYNSALSDANRQEVENYLMAKWGIS